MNGIISNIRQLTLSDAEKLEENLLDDIGLTDYEDDEHVKSDDWIIGDITFNEVVYTIIHGFPGDNASGIIYNANRKEYYTIGESMMEEDCQSIPQLWYLKATNDVTEFETLVPKLSSFEILILHETNAQNADDGCFSCGCSESIFCDDCKQQMNE